MAQTTAIEWTDLSWNPVHGCSVVSPGCAHCYAETLSLRYGQTKKPWTPANAAENVTLKPHKLREPLSHSKDWRGLGAAAASAGKTDGKLVFVNSTSDLFHEEVPDDFIAQVFAVIAMAPEHTFQILTKRPERMRDLLSQPAGTRGGFWASVWDHAVTWPNRDRRPVPVIVRDDEDGGQQYVLTNAWLGVSIENRRFIPRADILRDTPAWVRFISAEPLLGPLVPKIAGSFENPVAWWPDGRDTPCVPYDGIELTDIDWLIAGGESGPDHRPIDPEWVRDLRDTCEALDVAFFFKQWGGRTPKAGGRELDGRTWSEFPRAASLPVVADV